MIPLFSHFSGRGNILTVWESNQTVSPKHTIVIDVNQG